MSKNAFSITVTESLAGQTIEQALKEQWGFSKKLIHQWRMDKAIDLNGSLTQWKATLAEGDKVTIRLSGDAPTYKPADLAIKPLFEDEHLLIINKPAGIDTHPNDLSSDNTLVNGAVHYLMQKGHSGYAQPIHRLDRDTTGAILLAKHSAVKPLLDRMLEQRLIKRTYWALAEGHVKKKSGSINEPIGNDRHHNTRKRVSPSGQRAVTHFKTITHLKNQPLSWLELQLDTGRTHQIRVHLSYMGHPLAGDVLYGGKKTTKHSVQALHAVSISLKHPFTNEELTVVAPDSHDPPRFRSN
ncbi:RluA family pseudouridine synthase [Jeotgalibacillus sp. S-D1]|uniref:RluA family pseudouridine synthase n=1 Tax=Jeotgalibacillus sp. S-D1 TaxID=2552189 RepID=UPI001059734C|nr:RluA family pseudouridine synthase [Jeotgalibacillus sp. S-D1]TDL35436.1 RluA family pseudouridine synthase [Jeotgalibacillus sp. S-D1]